MPEATTDIDWDFIMELESYTLKGYVPDAGNSGVTVCCGIDLGQWSSSSSRYRLSGALVDKLNPYIGLKGHEARDCLLHYPLELTAQEGDELQSAVDRVFVEHLEYRIPQFRDFTPSQQTVVASLSWQYGDLETRCPKFYQCAVNGLWSAAVNELRHFGDAYTTRRNKEADLLQGSL